MVWLDGQIWLTKAWRPPLQCRQWSVHCLGDTNTCGIRYDLCRYIAARVAKNEKKDISGQAKLRPLTVLPQNLKKI